MIEQVAHVGVFLLETEARVDGRDDVLGLLELSERVGEDGGDG